MPGGRVESASKSAFARTSAENWQLASFLHSQQHSCRSLIQSYPLPAFVLAKVLECQTGPPERKPAIPL